MTRNKVKHVAITDENTRKSTLKKRTESLFKKANELATLCDVQVAAIIQDPKDNEEAVWPSREEAEEKVARFMSLPEMERRKKMTTHESFLVESVKSKYEKVKRLANKNDEREMLHLMKEFTSGKIRIQDFDLRQTDCMITYLNNVMKTLDRKSQELQYLEQQQQQNQLPSPEKLGSQPNDYTSFPPLQQLNQPAASELGSHSNDYTPFPLLQQNQPSSGLGGHSTDYTPFPLLQQNQPSLELGSHSTDYTPFPLLQQNQPPPEIGSHSDAYIPILPLQQQQDWRFFDPIPGAYSHFHHPAQQQPEQLPPGTSTDPYNVPLDPETIAALSNENAFLETMFGKQNMMNFYWQYDAGIGLPPTTDAPAPRQQNDTEFDQTAAADNIAQNDALPAPPNENTNSFGGANNK